MAAQCRYGRDGDRAYGERRPYLIPLPPQIIRGMPISREESLMRTSRPEALRLSQLDGLYRTNRSLLATPLGSEHGLECFSCVAMLKRLGLSVKLNQTFA